MKAVSQTSGTSTNIEARYRSLLIIWFAILTSVVMFFAMTLILERPTVLENTRLLIILLTATGTFLVVASFVPKQKLLEKAVERQRPQLVTTAYVIGLALAEMGAMFGLLTFFLTNDPYYYLLFILSALSLFLHLPRRAHLIAASFKGAAEGMTSR